MDPWEPDFTKHSYADEQRITAEAQRVLKVAAGEHDLNHCQECSDAIRYLSDQVARLLHKLGRLPAVRIYIADLETGDALVFERRLPEAEREQLEVGMTVVIASDTEEDRAGQVTGLYGEVAEITFTDISQPPD